MLMVQGVPPLGGVKEWWDGENFLALNVNRPILKTVGDTSKVTIND